MGACRCDVSNGKDIRILCITDLQGFQRFDEPVPIDRLWRKVLKYVRLWDLACADDLEEFY